MGADRRPRRSPNREDHRSPAPRRPDGGRRAPLHRGQSSFACPARAGEGVAPRRRADELDGQVGEPLPGLRGWAEGARFADVDGHEYVDFCLGDTGAMAGHSPAPTVAAVQRQIARGITTMLPSEDAVWVGEELSRRFGLPHWQFTLTATDANRFALRLARADHRPAQGRRPRPLLPRLGRRDVRLADAGRPGRGAARQPRPGRSTRRRRRRSCRSTTSRRWSAPSPPATWPSCSSSRP